jgi:hypothetical protein
VRSEHASAESRRVAAAVLEVLAGARTPGDAAQALGVSLPRYYALESRALAGLLAACERRPRGRVRTPESERARLESEVRRLERERARAQALLRASQRALGLAAVEPRALPPGRKRRSRRPSARALKAAARLKEGEKSLEQTPSPGDDAAVRSPRPEAAE